MNKAYTHSGAMIAPLVCLLAFFFSTELQSLRASESEQEIEKQSGKLNDKEREEVQNKRQEKDFLSRPFSTNATSTGTEGSQVSNRLHSVIRPRLKLLPPEESRNERTEQQEEELDLPKESKIEKEANWQKSPPGTDYVLRPVLPEPEPPVSAESRLSPQKTPAKQIPESDSSSTIERTAPGKKDPAPGKLAPASRYSKYSTRTKQRTNTGKNTLLKKKSKRLYKKSSIDPTEMSRWRNNES